MYVHIVEVRSFPMQAFCFVSSFSGDLIPPEAVMKLRQKNPLTVRVADEDRGEVVQDSNLLLSPSPIRLASVSSHLASFCRLVAGWTTVWYFDCSVLNEIISTTMLSIEVVV